MRKRILGSVFILLLLLSAWQILPATMFNCIMFHCNYKFICDGDYLLDEGGCTFVCYFGAEHIFVSCPKEP